MSEFILLDSQYNEIGPADFEADFEVGTASSGTNNFKAETTILKDIDFAGFYVDGTEIGGMINFDKKTNLTDIHVIEGYTWRGKLERYVVTPPAGSAYKTVSGDLNEVIAELIYPVRDLFEVTSDLTGCTVTNYRINRYVTVLSAIDRLLADNGYRLEVVAKKEAAGNPIKIYLSAIEQTTLDGIYDSDLNIPMQFESYRQGYNHIIAAGKGELENRQIVNLYLDEEGNVTTTQYFFDLDENTYFYDYSNAESLEELTKAATDKLKELRNKDILKLTSTDLTGEEVNELEIGDKILTKFPGESEITAIVESKIYKVQNGRIETQLKVKGEV